MQNIIKYLLLLACFSPQLAQAQPKIKFTYDAAGNRIQRELVPMFSGSGDNRSEAALATETALTKDQINVWPNPADYQLNIEVSNKNEAENAETDNMRAELFDVSGRLAKEMTLNGNPAIMTVEDLPPGTYFLFVRKGEQWLKWTVQKI